jgi:hypothetical protein
MSETTSPPVTEGSRGVPTKKDVTALLLQFEPAPPPQLSAADRERDKRIEKARAAVRACAKSFEDLGVTAGDAAKAAAALKGLLTAQKNATAALEGLTPRQLGVDGEDAAPKQRRTRQPKGAQGAQAAQAAATGPVKIEEPVPTLPSAPPVTPKPEPESDPDEGHAAVSPEELDARIKAARAERGAPTTHRSGPTYGTASAASGDVRGETDPNLGDGF